MQCIITLIYNDFQNDIVDPSTNVFAHQNCKEEFHLELSREERRGDFICHILSYLLFLISQCSPYWELTPCTFCLCHLPVMAALDCTSTVWCFLSVCKFTYRFGLPLIFFTQFSICFLELVSWNQIRIQWHNLDTRCRLIVFH